MSEKPIARLRGFYGHFAGKLEIEREEWTDEHPWFVLDHQREGDPYLRGWGYTSAGPQNLFVTINDQHLRNVRVSNELNVSIAARRTLYEAERIHESALRERSRLFKERHEIRELKEQMLGIITELVSARPELAKILERHKSAPEVGETRNALGQYIEEIGDAAVKTFGQQPTIELREGDPDAELPIVVVLDFSKCHPKPINERRAAGARYDFYKNVAERLPETLMDEVGFAFQFP